MHLADFGEFSSLDDEICLKVAVIFFITMLHVRYVSAFFNFATCKICFSIFFFQIKHKSLPLLTILPFYTMVVSGLWLCWVEVNSFDLSISILRLNCNNQIVYCQFSIHCLKLFM